MTNLPPLTLKNRVQGTLSQQTSARFGQAMGTGQSHEDTFHRQADSTAKPRFASNESTSNNPPFYKRKGVQWGTAAAAVVGGAMVYNSHQIENDKIAQKQLTASIDATENQVNQDLCSASVASGPIPLDLQTLKVKNGTIMGSDATGTVIRMAEYGLACPKYIETEISSQKVYGFFKPVKDKRVLFYLPVPANDAEKQQFEKQLSDAFKLNRAKFNLDIQDKEVLPEVDSTKVIHAAESGLVSPEIKEMRLDNKFVYQFQTVAPAQPMTFYYEIPSQQMQKIDFEKQLLQAFQKNDSNLNQLTQIYVDPLADSMTQFAQSVDKLGDKLSHIGGNQALVEQGNSPLGFVAKFILPPLVITGGLIWWQNRRNRAQGVGQQPALLGKGQGPTEKKFAELEDNIKTRFTDVGGQKDGVRQADRYLSYVKRLVKKHQVEQLLKQNESAPEKSTLQKFIPGLKNSKAEQGVNLASISSLLMDDEEDLLDPPKGATLTGPPGTGKTLMARAIAGEAGIPFLFVSGSEFVEKFVGTGAERVRGMFERAGQLADERGGCIIFVDEAESLGAKRSNSDNGGAQENNQTTNQFLALLDNVSDKEKRRNIFVLMATNNPEGLDPALVRSGRIEQTIKMDLPAKPEQREEILNIHFKANKLSINGIEDPTKTLKEIADFTDGMNGADLARILREASYMQDHVVQQALKNAETEAIEKGEYTQEALDDLHAKLETVRQGKIKAPEELQKIAEAASKLSQLKQKIKAELGGPRQLSYGQLLEAIEVVQGGEPSNYFPKKEDHLRVARHEFGHCLVSKAAGIEPRTISMQPRDKGLGYIIPDTRNNSALGAKDELLSSILLGMGGQAAEHAFYGRNISGGASGDITQCRDRVKGMIISGMFYDHNANAYNSPYMDLTKEDKELMNNIIKNARNTAISIMEYIKTSAPTQLDSLVDDSLKPENYVLRTQEARNFVTNHLGADFDWAPAQKMVEAFLEDPAGEKKKTGLKRNHAKHEAAMA